MDTLVTLTKTSDKICQFCNLPDVDPIKYGPLYLLDDVVAHYYCVLLSHKMQQKGADEEGILGFLLPDIVNELKRSKKISCSYCGKAGASLECSLKKCQIKFHLPCGLQKGSMHQFENHFKSFCFYHRPRQDIRLKAIKEAELSTVICSICYDNVNYKDEIDTLWAPCCSKTWYHRLCVQKLALSAGYFFKCAICNNSDKFRSWMLRFGIYIPERDASWELEDHAFEDLQFRYNKCDAEDCKCPGGRHDHREDTRWEIIVCQSCGSQGIHIGCGKLKFLNPEWECNGCKKVTEQVPPQQEKRLTRNVKRKIRSIKRRYMWSKGILRTRKNSQGNLSVKRRILRSGKKIDESPMELAGAPTIAPIRQQEEKVTTGNESATSSLQPRTSNRKKGSTKKGKRKRKRLSDENQQPPVAETAISPPPIKRAKSDEDEDSQRAKLQKLKEFYEKDEGSSSSDAVTASEVSVASVATANSAKHDDQSNSPKHDSASSGSEPEIGQVNRSEAEEEVATEEVVQDDKVEKKESKDKKRTSIIEGPGANTGSILIDIPRLKPGPLCFKLAQFRKQIGCEEKQAVGESDDEIVEVPVPPKMCDLIDLSDEEEPKTTLNESFHLTKQSYCVKKNVDLDDDEDDEDCICVEVTEPKTDSSDAMTMERLTEKIEDLRSDKCRILEESRQLPLLVVKTEESSPDCVDTKEKKNEKEVDISVVLIANDGSEIPVVPVVSGLVNVEVKGDVKVIPEAEPPAAKTAAVTQDKPASSAPASSVPVSAENAQTAAQSAATPAVTVGVRPDTSAMMQSAPPPTGVRMPAPGPNTTGWLAPPVSNQSATGTAVTGRVAPRPPAVTSAAVQTAPPSGQPHPGRGGNVMLQPPNEKWVILNGKMYRLGTTNSSEELSLIPIPDAGGGIQTQAEVIQARIVTPDPLMTPLHPPQFSPISPQPSPLPPQSSQSHASYYTPTQPSSCVFPQPSSYLPPQFSSYVPPKPSQSFQPRVPIAAPVCQPFVSKASYVQPAPPRQAVPTYQIENPIPRPSFSYNGPGAQKPSSLVRGPTSAAPTNPAGSSNEFLKISSVWSENSCNNVQGVKMGTVPVRKNTTPPKNIQTSQVRSPRRVPGPMPGPMPGRGIFLKTTEPSRPRPAPSLPASKPTMAVKPALKAVPSASQRIANQTGSGSPELIVLDDEKPLKKPVEPWHQLQPSAMRQRTRKQRIGSREVIQLD